MLVHNWPDILTPSEINHLKMKIRNTLIPIATLLASTLVSQANTTLAVWDFDNLPVGINSSPSPSAGLGSAKALGMDNSYNNTNSLSNPDVQSLAGSSSGGAKSWRIRGYSTVSGSRGNGWSTNAPIGTQGAQFAGSTFGYYQVKVSFDVYATADAEANLQVQYTTDGSTWNPAAIASVGTLGVIATNTDSSQDTVVGSYVKLGSGWNNQITVDLSGLSGVDNNPSFGIRLVNASMGTNCVDTTGTIYNNTSGNWTFDNVAIQGTSIDTIADWTFESEPNDGTVITNPVPEIGGDSAGRAYSIGFDNGYDYGSKGIGSIDASDVSNTGGSSSGDTGPNAWRVRGAIPASGKAGIGWNTEAPIGAQGAEYDVSTVGYSNIVCSFDLYFTSAAEAKMCVFYTTDGWVTTNVAQTLFYGADPTLIQTNDTSVHTVMGNYFYETNGQGFYNNIIVDFTGVADVDNNPLFGFRVVNAATGLNDCVNSGGTTYNNSSGNWRYDNIMVGGTAGTPPPTLAYDPNASVDGPFTNTFTDNPTWRAKIASIYVNGELLPNAAYATNIAGEIVFTPASSVLLQSSGVKNISIVAPGFGTAKVIQPLAAGVATKLEIATQPAAPSASGGTLTANPVLLVSDQYGNGTTNPYPNVSVLASVGGSGGWTLGGDTNQVSVDGMIAFTNLTATVDGSSAISGAVVTFTLTGYPPVAVTNSSAFDIGAPPANFIPGDLAVLQIDTTKNNTTFSIIEIKPAAAGQIAPVNIVPISATGTNALRLSSSGSCGKLSLSDDGTLVCFAAFADDSAATHDETFNLNRVAAGVDYTNQLTIGMRYISTSLGGSQARSCTALNNNTTWIADDKGGLYQGSSPDVSIDQPNLNPYNNIVVKTFGGIPYVQTQKTVSGVILPVVYALGFDSDTSLYDVTKANNLTTDQDATDFYLVSTNGGSTYDILYILDGISPVRGIIKKYSLVNGDWIASGSFNNGTGGDSLFATTNGNGGVCLYYTTGESANNSVVRLTDASGWNAPMNIISSNVLYTATGDTYLKGLTFAPQPTANAVELTPPPILTAQAGVLAGNSFSVTCTPDDPAWRSAITSITVDGSVLPTAAYDVTQAGVIVFDPVQSPGAKNIVITATGYSDDSVVQTIGSNVGSILSGVTMNNGMVSFTFTNYTGLTFSVLGTNDLTAPINTWPVIGTAVEDTAGQYHFSGPEPTNSQEFYILRQP